jgi:mannose-6-phosphate isomerase-like protein (cupin superfamily)
MRNAVITACGFVLLAYVTLAQAPGPSLWTATQLKDLEKTLAPRIDATRSAGQVLSNAGTHVIQVSYRDGSGEAEVHEHVTDVFVVQSGEATIAVGGTLVNARTTAAGEIRATSATGAKLMQVHPGDVLNIPAGTPHQVVIEAGKTFYALIVKVTS